MILVTGAKGMLGSYVERFYQDEPLCLTDLDTFDICNYEQGKELFEQTHPGLVIHLAAETDVDRCEREPDHAFRSNVVGTQNVARLAADYGAELLYVSTTGVFDGTKKELYTEFDRPNPLNVYARTKYEAEKIVQRCCPRSYILRAGWVFGGGPTRDKKFVGKIVSLCTLKDEIRVVDDKLGSPTYAVDFVRNSRIVVESGYYGTYHLTSAGSCSRYEFACELVDILDLDTKVIPVSSDEFPLPANRPDNDAARNYHLEMLGLNHMRPWQEALGDYLKGWPIEQYRGS